MDSNSKKVTFSNHNPNAEGLPRYLDIKELAIATKMSLSTLHRLRKKGVLKGFQPGGPRHRMVFHPDAIEQLAPWSHQQLQETKDVPSSAPQPKRGPQPSWKRKGL